MVGRGLMRGDVGCCWLFTMVVHRIETPRSGCGRWLAGHKVVLLQFRQHGDLERELLLESSLLLAFPSTSTLQVSSSSSSG